MKNALRKAGVTGKSIARGEIYVARDDIIQYPAVRLPDQPPRTTHMDRPVVVLQADIYNQDTTYITALIAPLSTTIEKRNDTDYLLELGDGGTWKQSMVELSHIQPILKTELQGSPLGKLDNLIMNEIDAMIANTLGLIEESSL